MNLTQTEPVLTASAIGAAVVALAAVFGVVLDTNVVETVLAAVLPVLAAIVARHFVTPVAKAAPITSKTGAK